MPKEKISKPSKEPTVFEHQLSQLEVDLKSALEDRDDKRIKEISRNISNLKKVITHIKNRG